MQAEHLLLDEVLSDPTEPPSYQPGSTQPGASPATSSRNWRLTSTLISPQRRIAVVNGHALKPGDTIEGVTVLEITPATVQLRDTQGDFSVTMQPATVKIRSGRTTTSLP